VLLTGLGGLLGVFVGVAITVSGGLILPMFVESFPPATRVSWSTQHSSGLIMILTRTMLS
jgi:hypothetical protein